jgi:hypothetical protein
MNAETSPKNDAAPADVRLMDTWKTSAVDLDYPFLYYNFLKLSFVHISEFYRIIIS